MEVQRFGSWNKYSDKDYMKRLTFKDTNWTGTATFVIQNVLYGRSAPPYIVIIQ